MYSKIGQLLLSMATDLKGSPAVSSDAGNTNIEGDISRRIANATGEHFDRQEIWEYLYRGRTPMPQFIPAFAEAYSLTVRERRLLAWAYTYSELPQSDTLEHPPPFSME